MPSTAKEIALEKMEKQEQFQLLLNQVKDVNVNNTLSLRKNRASIYDQKSPSYDSAYQKKVSLEKRLRRGRNMHMQYFRTENERLDFERREDEVMQKPLVDYEYMLNDYPKRFNVAKCLSNDRTFPHNKVSPRAKLAH